MPTKKTVELLPYMTEYYDSSDKPMCWLPSVMTMTVANHRSKVLNTDVHGFRLTASPNVETISIEHNAENLQNLLIGGSAGLGVGASSDAQTLPSQLAALSGESWGNFCVRGHTLQQQLSQFTYFATSFKSLRRIVLFCGLNEIEAFHRCVMMPRVHGPFYAWNRYFQLMNSHLFDRKTRTYTGPEDGHLIRIASHEKDWENVARIFDNTLSAWALFAKALNAQIIYFFQPLPSFMKRRLSPEEKGIHAHMANADPDSFKIRTKQNLRAYRKWYQNSTEQSCKKYGIPFIDLNNTMDGSAHARKWLFVDTCHLTDLGHAICASEMHQHLTAMSEE